MPPEPGLAEFLSDRARRASDTRLALDASLGVIVAVAALVWRPWGWPVMLGAALAFAGFGGWAIADRELADRQTDHGASARALRIVRAVSATVGALAGVETLLALLGIALGTLIS